MNVIKAGARRVGLRRGHVAVARMCCERNVLAALGSARGKPRARILCYHSVGTREWGVNDVSPARFRRHIELALAEGYRFIPAAKLAAGGGGPKELALTFDDGLMSVARNAAPVVAEFGLPWTLFIVSDWAEGRHPFGDGMMMGWREIERLAADGATIASHSVTHPNFRHLGADAALHELAHSREVIASRLGITTTEFAIPLGTSRDWTRQAAALARQAGYETVYAQSEDRRAAGTVPRSFITHFDNDRVFRAALTGAFDRWEEWL